MTTVEIVDSTKSMVSKVRNLKGTIFYRITCEVAVFKGDLYVDLPDSMDDGWVTPEKLVKIMDWVSNREAD